MRPVIRARFKHCRQILGSGALALALHQFATPAHAEEGFGLDVSGAYIADGSMWVQGKKEQAEFHYTGYQQTIGVLSPRKSAKVPAYDRPYISVTYLTNNHSENGVEKTTETITNYAAGYEVILLSDILGGVQFNGAASYENATLKLRGPEPVDQQYNVGLGIRLGVGYGPTFGNSGFYARVEYQAKLFMAGRDSSDSDISLRDVQFQTFTPVLGFALIAF